MEAKTLYDAICNSLSPQRLNEISQKLIEAYRNGNNALLTAFNRSILDQSGEEKEIPPGKTFLKLIKHFHPDRYETLSSDINASYNAGDIKKLVFYRNLLSADTLARREMESRLAFDFEETFAYDAEGTAYSAFAMDSEDPLGSVSEHDFDLDFLAALKTELFGNLDFEFSIHDLEQLEGDLVLRGYGIQDLEGIDYCANITKLDLSGNRIDSLHELSSLGYLRELYLAGNEITDLDPLADLENLEIIDLSHNDIENADILASLPNLVFLNLRGNPVHSVDMLKANGITVLV